MALRDQKARMFATYWDVVSLAQQIATEKIDVSEQLPFLFNVVKFKAQIEQFITQVDALIWAKLRVYYPIDTLLGDVEDARVTTPTPGSNNQGDTELISVLLNQVVANDVYTATWLIRFTTSAKYNLYSSLEAAQGTDWDITDATKTSSNGEITILDSYWVENFADFVRGDQFFFSVHRVHPFILFCSNLLSTAMAMTSLYVAESPNMSEFGATLWNRGMSFIHQLVLAAEGQAIKGEGEGMMVGASLDDIVPEWDLDTLFVDYEVTDLGLDLSPSLTDNAGTSLYGEGDPLVG